MSDNELDHDLSAWEAPPAPAGIADAVLARMDDTGVVPAVPERPHSGGRRTMLIAGVAAACLAASAGTYMMVRSSRPSGPTSGAVVATAARTLSLGGATAELDAGADVRWQRHGDVLNVEQRAGSAAWRVDKDMRLLIDAGVTVASVDASGASLRVEVQMNSMDAKILGGSAVTAAAVSLVAVTVYSGAVKVHDGGQTVVVQPGTTYSVKPVTTPPPTPELVGAAPVTFDASRPTIADVRIPAGEAATLHVPWSPATVEIDAGDLCAAGVEYYADGARSSGPLLTLDAGAHGYAVRCAGDTVNAATGMLSVVVDDARKPLVGAAANRLAYIAAPAGGVAWSDPLDVAGEIRGAAKVSIAGVPIPNVSGGRFSVRFPRPASLAVALRVERPTRDVDYFVLRGTDVTLATSCDEVSCVLDNYEGACCEKFKAPTATSLDRATIASVMSSLKPQLQACAQQEPGQGGTLTLKVEVAPDGSVIRADAANSYSDAVSACVTNIVHHATFPATKNGGAFNYPYIFKTTLTVGAGSSTVASAPTGLTREDISKAIAGVKSRIQSCAAKTSQSGKVKVQVNVRPDGKVKSLATLETFDPAVSGCILDILKTLSFPATDDGGAFTYPFVITGTGTGSAAPVASATCDEVSCVMGTGDAACCAKFKKAAPLPPANCDAEASKEKGMENVNMGQHAAALAQFEASLRCKPDPFVVQLAFMSACSSRNAVKARLYFPKLTPTQQSKFAVICTRNGIDPTAPKSAAACDAKALKDEGMEAVNLAEHAKALEKFEASLACKADSYVTSLAYMSSCNSKNATKARTYYAQLTPAQQTKFEQLCIRNGIDPTAAAVPPKTPCDAEGLKDDGIEKASLGEHTEAAASLESSYRCKADPTLPQMIVREACAAQNAPLARTWYAKLPASEQKLVNTFCTGVGIKLLDPGTVPSGTGYLVVLSTPAARIFVDGIDTGLTTPITGKALQLKAGDHKVTYVLPSGDRFTYKATVPSGGAVTLSKNLQ